MTDTWRYRCPECGNSSYEYRPTKTPAYLCLAESCGAEFEEPADAKEVPA